ncbi:FG-GAP repeat domain-containing protein [Kribbella deserti]|uniref:FG-GAP repeat domain-containing protein n=1 Tax=Kribbella deserti TaxID=1926257 RepID=A0ABV6QN54_9ACTN
MRNWINSGGFRFAAATILASLFAVSATTSAEARMNQSQVTDERSASCYLRQLEHDAIWAQAWQKWNARPPSQTHNRRSDYLTAAQNSRLDQLWIGWSKNCNDFGWISQRSQWSPDATEWAHSANENWSRLKGDFTGDGKTDIISLGEFDLDPNTPGNQWGLRAHVAYPTLGIAGQAGQFASKSIDSTIGSFLLKEAMRADVDEIAGDFNGDGRTDFLFTSQGVETVSMLLSNTAGGYTFNSTRLAGIGDWLQYRGKVVAGDFNGDGNADLALFSRTPKPSFIVAQSNGNGTFRTLLRSSGTRFSIWAADPEVQILVGNFDNSTGDRDDLLLWGKNCYEAPTSTGGTECRAVMPLMTSGLHSMGGIDKPQKPGYLVPYSPNGPDGAAPRMGQAKPVVGDFNQDGNDDLLNFQRWPLGYEEEAGDLEKFAFVSFAGVSTMKYEHNTAIDQHLVKRVLSPGAMPVSGDFNADGYDDVAVVGSFDKVTMPLLRMGSTTSFFEKLISSGTSDPCGCTSPSTGTNG